MTSTQPYQIRFEQRPNYLYAHAKAETLNQETALAYVKEIVDEAVRRDHKRLIVERDIPATLSSGEQFFATEAFTGMITGMRVVFINPYPELDDDMNFAKTIA